MKRRIAAMLWIALACVAVYSASAAKSMPLAPALFLDWNADCASLAHVSRALDNVGICAGAAVWSDNGDYAEYCGDWRLLTGNSLIFGQYGGLTVSRELALARFGSEDVVGREIDMGGKTLAINGVYAVGVANALLESADAYKNRAHMALAFPDSPLFSWQSEADALLAASGLGEPSSVKDGALLYALCDMSFFRSLIPTRWADFGVWKSNVDGVIARVGRYICQKLEPLQAEYLWQCASFMAKALLAVALSLQAWVCTMRLVNAKRKTSPPFG